MRSNPHSLRKNTRAASPAVSAVIITAVTVALVLISSLYAMQMLTRQEAGAEFQTVQNSFLAFDDAVRDIAWDPVGSRSTRFTVKYGSLRLINDNTAVPISASGIDGTYSYSFNTGLVKYQMPYGYGVSGSGSSYILGDSRNVISRLSDSLGQVLVEYRTESVDVVLRYRVRVAEEGQVFVDSTSTTINYVDIFVIRLNCVSSVVENTEFDLVSKNIGTQTLSSDVYKVNAPDPSISVGDGSNPIVLDFLQAGNNPDGARYVVFNLIISDVRVST